jgi:hypothetical protein
MRDDIVPRASAGALVKKKIIENARKGRMHHFLSTLPDIN